MRKRVTSSAGRPDQANEGNWLDLERLVTVEVTSEDAAYPIESALQLGELAHDAGWRAAGPGRQLVRLVFDEPHRLRRIWLHVVEPHDERTQEFVLRCSSDAGRTFREVVRQQWHFSPTGATTEIEDYRVDLEEVAVLELEVTPDVSGGTAPASLRRLRLA
jgi:hypothetical protein